MNKIKYPDIIVREELDIHEIEIDGKELIRLDKISIRRDDGEQIGWVDYGYSLGEYAIKLNPKYDYILGKDNHDNISLVPIKKR